MIECIATIITGLLWLGFESDWLRVRLPMGAIVTTIHAPIPEAHSCACCGAVGVRLTLQERRWLGGLIKTYHVCPSCLEAIQDRPNKAYEDATKRAAVKAWTVAKEVANSRECNPQFDSPEMGKWLNGAAARFQKKYADWPQGIVVRVDGQVRMEWHNASWSAEPPKNFGKLMAKAYNVKNIKSRKPRSTAVRAGKLAMAS